MPEKKQKPIFQKPAPFAVPVEGKLVYIQFKIPFCSIPGQGKNLDTLALAKSESALSAKYMAEAGKQKPNKANLQRLQAQMVMPDLVAGYLDTEAKSSVFDIVEAPAAKK